MNFVLDIARNYPFQLVIVFLLLLSVHVTIILTNLTVLIVHGAKTPKIGFFVPIGGTSATIYFFNLHLLKFTKLNDINAESVAFLMK